MVCVGVGGVVWGFVDGVWVFLNQQYWNYQVPVQTLLRIKDSKEFSVYFRMQEGPQTILLLKPNFALAAGTALDIAEVVLPLVTLVQCKVQE